MPKTLESLWREFDEHTKQIDENKEDITNLKKGYDVLFAWKKEVEKWRIQNDENFQDLKKTILEENKDTRSFLKEMLQNQWDLIKSRDSMLENDRVRKHEIQKSKIEKYSEVIIKIGAAGGVLYVIIQAVINSLGGN